MLLPLTLALALAPALPQDPPRRLQPLVPAPPAAQDEAKLPRPVVLEDLPYTRDRALLDVEGVQVTAAELNLLVAYYRSFRPGSDALLLRDAVDALLPSKVVEARLGGELADMRKRIDAARQALVDGRPWEEVVAEWSDDSEAPTPDARYEFVREVAVQPFDRLTHTAPAGTITEPFLTKYGYHVLQVLDYARDDEDPTRDTATVRHVLVMYPTLRAKDKAGEDIRAWIRAQVADAAVKVLEKGQENLLPVSHRAAAAPAQPGD